MFLWYQRATKCYVYLSDVSFEGPSSQSFKTSRWFTRGWTLQELLAPVSVEFFSIEGKKLGDKGSLVQDIADITGISVKALKGKTLSEFGVDERMEWEKSRETSREEDIAYALLGIFNVYMPLIYGEGKENALKRLQKEIRESTGNHSQSQKESLNKIHKWLSAPDPSTNYHEAHKQRQADTGLWLLESERFMRWKMGAPSWLWLYGIPGCGKTILSSTVLQDLIQHCHGDPRMAVLYFYFDFNDRRKQDPELMLRSLASQLSQHSPKDLEHLGALISSCGDGQRQPSLHELMETTEHMMQDFTHVYLVLDALDECTQRSELLNMLEAVAGWGLQNLHVLMTSRKERDIESSLESYIDEDYTICLQSDVVDKDIQQYIRQRLSDDKSLAKWEKDYVVRQEIEKALMDGACGMFRWAACQLDTLGKCRNRSMLRKSLAALPPTLDQTYDRILVEINEDDSMYAFRILQWLTFSAQPLSIEEIAEAAAIDAERDIAFDRDEVLEDPLEALNICSSLIIVTENSKDAQKNPGQRVVALSHYSVQEYLFSDRIKQSQARQYSMQDAVGHDTLAKGCLKYLLQLQQPELPLGEVLEQYKLAMYSAKFWTGHACKTKERIENIGQIAINLFSVDNPTYLIWIRLCNPDAPWEGPNPKRTLKNMPTPLYYAAQTGLLPVVRLLLERGAGIDAQCGIHNSALQAASFKGHEQVVRFLLAQGADVNTQGERGCIDALQAASYEGHTRLVELLLDHGANVNAQGEQLGTALQAASIKGHTQVVKLLLDHGADVNAQGGAHNNALQAACRFNNIEIVKLLLSKKAIMTSCNDDGSTALNAAVSNNYTEIAKLLLENGIYSAVSGLDPQFGTIANLLAFYGFTDLIRFSHENLQADLFLKEPYGRTPLHLAARGGHVDTFQYLINQGLDPTALDKKGDGLACYAASSGSLDILDAVFNQGQMVEDFESNNGFHTLPESVNWTPLHWACKAGNAEVVEQLARKDIRSKCVTVPEPEGDWSPLDIAYFHGHEKMLENLSSSCRSLLGAKKDASQQRGKINGDRCIGCLHRIYGPSFNCLSCLDLNYCFMCRPFLDSLHLGHEWQTFNPL